MRGIIENLAQRAHRPARAQISGEANIVLFDDHAELLACLALDWLRGDASRRWWWSSLFPGASVLEAVGRAWMDAPQHVPNALSQLHERKQSIAFMEALPPAVLAKISTNVAQTFALDELREAVEGAAAANPTRNGTGEAASNHLGNSSPREQLAPQMPWSNWVQVNSRLPPEAQSLLVLSVMLTRVPAVVQSLNFIGCVRDFASAREVSRGQMTMSAQSFDREKVRSNATIVSEPRLSGIPSTFSRPTFPSAESILSQSPCEPEIELAHKSSLPAPKENAQAGASLQRDDFSRSLEWERESECVYSTEWGGIFYLINIALALELYGDFTQPRRASLPLPLWDFLALMGRTFIGRAFVEDDCWTALASLSQRNGRESPGAWFEPPEEWRVPLSWLAAFPEKTGWCGGIFDGRISLQHPAGFSILDAPCDARTPAAAFHDECARFGVTPNAVQPLLKPEHSPAAPPLLERWLERLAEYIEARLARSLKNPGSAELRQLVFAQKAELLLNSEQLIVRFSLSAHPIALRIAGLDRDPGWVPAAGRTIVFRYE